MRTSSRRFKAAEAIRSTIYSPGCIRPDSEAGPRCNRSFTKMPSLMLPHTLKPRPVKSRLRRLTTLTRVALGCTKQNGRGPICYTGDEDNLLRGSRVLFAFVTRTYAPVYTCVDSHRRAVKLPIRRRRRRRSMNGNLADDKLISQERDKWRRARAEDTIHVIFSRETRVILIDI